MTAARIRRLILPAMRQNSIHKSSCTESRMEAFRLPETMVWLYHGEYVIFADGDDAFIPETYKFARNHLEQNGPDILVTDHLNWLDDGNGACIAPQPRTHQPFVNCTNQTENPLATLTDCMPCTWTRFIKRDLLKQFPRPFSENLMYDDLPLIPHITARASSLYYVPLPLIKYRSRPNSVTKSRSYRSCTDMVAAAAQASKATQTLPLDTKYDFVRRSDVGSQNNGSDQAMQGSQNPSFYRLYDEIIRTALTAFKSLAFRHLYSITFIPIEPR